MRWLNTICEEVNRNYIDNNSHPFSLQNLLFGYHWQYVPSCVAARLQAQSFTSFHEQQIVADCQRDIMWMLKPEGVLRVMHMVAASNNITSIPTSASSTPANSSTNSASSSLAPFIEEYLTYYNPTSLQDFLSRTAHSMENSGILPSIHIYSNVC
jgi:hypothetical protein